MLVLSTLQTVFLYGKLRNQVELHHDALYRLEVAAEKISVEKSPLDCLIPLIDPNKIIDQLLQNRGCLMTDDGRQYVYMVGDLGVYPCLQILSGSKLLSSHHWLVSIRSGPPRQAILQLRIAKPVELILCGFSEPRQINRGVISWRHLPVV